MTTINARIQHLIDIKAAGNKIRFNGFREWELQYVTKFTSDDGFVGVSAVARIL